MQIYRTKQRLDTGDLDTGDLDTGDIVGTPNLVPWERSVGLRKRTCHFCRLPILRGEVHYRHEKMVKRVLPGGKDALMKEHRNACMICYLEANERYHIESQEVIQAIKKYLEEHPKIKGRRLLYDIKRGKALR